ncbi:hypothetical protein OPQ81_003578 [Rhizoctonia solani]|nr:hypothetical protein OPQ81_003578 [Rhizoctonia solani]
MSNIENGVYIFSVPMGQGCITDPGEGRFLHLLPHGALGEDADKIRVNYNQDKGAYSLQFEKSKKYLSFLGEPSMNNKLVPDDKPRYFKIERHPYYPDMHVVKIAEDKSFHVGMALERIFPPWIAMTKLPEMQPWEVKQI